MVLTSIGLVLTKFITQTNAEFLLSIEELTKTYPQLLVWASALSTTFFISVIPYLVLFLIPLNNTPEYESHLKLCLSLAAGGLLGDAFLHLIPESLHTNNSNNLNHSLNVGLWILTGFFGFFVVEKMVRIAKEYSNSCEITSDKKVNSFISFKNNNNNKRNDNNQSFDNSVNQICVTNREKQWLKIREFLRSFKEIKIGGYLNLVADLVHNFTDGLAIGSSFMAGHNVGLITGIAIMVHEIPHEIGDYAVLIKSGCSRKRAMSLQLLTAIGALTGTVVSLTMGGSDRTSSDWVLPFTGGGFIYIGTVTILPELTNGTDFKQSFKELFALLFGIFIMVLIV